MKRILLALVLLLIPAAASAQCNGVFPNNTVCGNITGSNATPRPTNPTAFLGAAGGTNGQIQYNNAGALGGFGPITGDVLLTVPGAVTTIQNKTGNGTKIATSTGTLTSGNCVQIDANGNLIDSGAPCKPPISIRIVTAAGAVTITTADQLVIINKTVGAATVVNLPSTPPTGFSVTIKDGKGDAYLNNLTITPAAGQIENASVLSIYAAFTSVTLVYNGTQWNVI